MGNPTPSKGKTFLRTRFWDSSHRDNLVTKT